MITICKSELVAVLLVRGICFHNYKFNLYIFKATQNKILKYII